MVIIIHNETPDEQLLHGKLQWEWEHSEEDFHGALVGHFKKHLKAVRYIDSVNSWLREVPFEYWKCTKNKGMFVQNTDDTCIPCHIKFAYRIEVFFPDIIKVIEFILTANAASSVASPKTMALLFAVASGELSLTKQLIEEHGADVNALDSRSWSSLCFALESGDLEMTKLLLGYGATCDFSKTKLFSPVTGAIENNDTELLEIVLGMDPGSGVHWARTFEANLSLRAAARRGQRDMMLGLVKKGAKAQLSEDTEEDFRIDLLCSVAAFHSQAKDDAEFRDFVKWFLTNEHFRYDSEVSDEHRAVETFEKIVQIGDEQIFQVLIQRRVIDFCTSGSLCNKIWDNLIRADKDKRQYKTFKFFLKEAHRLKRSEFSFEILLRVLLYKAVEFENIPAVRHLLKRGALIYGMPLEEAMGQHNLPITSLLLLHGADFINVEDLMLHLHDAREIPHDNPLEKDQEEIIRLLLKYIALLNFLGNEELHHDLMQHLRSYDESLYNSNSWNPLSKKDIIDFYEICRNELSLMKNYFICGSVSFFHVMWDAKKLHRKPSVVEALANVNIRQRFPIYNRILSERLNREKKRRELIPMATIALEKIMKLTTNSYAVVYDNIFANLSSHDLRNLALI